MIDDIENASPLVAAFIRGFMEKTDADRAPRACGEAGREAAEALGFAMSSAYISRVTKNMVKWGVITKVRNGKHYVVQEGPFFQELRHWLGENENYGLIKFKPGEYVDRGKATRVMNEEGGLIFDNGDMRVPRGGWGILQSNFKKGLIKGAYVPADAQVYVRLKGSKKAKRLKSWDMIELENLDDE